MKWQPQIGIDYSHLSERERGLKPYRELYEIFYKYRNPGLTIRQLERAVSNPDGSKRKGYANETPKDIIRSNIHKWNKMTKRDFGLPRVVSVKMAGSLTKYYIEPQFSRVLFGTDQEAWTPPPARGLTAGVPRDGVPKERVETTKNTETAKTYVSISAGLEKFAVGIMV